MENIPEHIIASMSLNKDLDDYYFATENCFDSATNLQGETNPYSESMQQELSEHNLLPKENYWKNSTHIMLQNSIGDVPGEQLMNYDQAN